MMKRFSLVLVGCTLSLIGVGCGEQAILSVPTLKPMSSSVGYRVAIEETADEVQLALPTGSMRSEVALTSLDSTHACIEVVMRTWDGASAQWIAWADSDGLGGARNEVELASCTTSAECLTQPSVLGPLPTDVAPSVAIRAANLCMPIPHEASRELAFNFTQGALHRRFVFQARD
ncbi:MAG: hypothetical protein IPK60_00625 [Sandaracinaceae bacterium]|nr:hypothetical protein [Sandaracinaceae bacterium]